MDDSSDHEPDKIRADIEALRINTDEILEAIQARKGHVYAALVRSIYAAMQHIVTIEAYIPDQQTTKLCKSAMLHMSRISVYLDEVPELKGILEDVTMLTDRVNKDWHSKGHM